MKRLGIIFFGILLMSLTGCDENEGFLGRTNMVNPEGVERSYKVVHIEDCEYIVYDAGSGHIGNGFMAHKGNCSNPIHECP